MIKMRIRPGLITSVKFSSISKRGLGMSFKRLFSPTEPSDREALTAQMIGIGMNFAGVGDAHANIEDTLLFSSIEGMERGDLRVLSVLTTWLEVHHTRINVERLVGLVNENESIRVRAFWRAVGQWL